MEKTNKISRPGRASRSGSGNPSADPKKGAVLLIAILMSSVALAVGFGVYNRTYKELLFASFWKQTQIAFSAADSGLECMLYWQLHPSTGSPAGSAQCFGPTVPGWTPPNATTGSIDIDVPGGGCANVTVAWDGAKNATTTVAHGYNNSCATKGTNPRTVERGLGVALQ